MNPRAGRGTIRYSILDEQGLIEAIDDLESLILQANRLRIGIGKASELLQRIEGSIFRKYGKDLNACLGYMKAMHFDRMRQKGEVLLP